MNINSLIKFFPINASDYDEEIIDAAREGEYAITSAERSAMRKHTNGKWDNYFENDGPNCIKPKKTLNPPWILKYQTRLMKQKISKKALM